MALKCIKYLLCLGTRLQNQSSSIGHDSESSSQMPEAARGLSLKLRWDAHRLAFPKRNDRTSNINQHQLRRVESKSTVGTGQNWGNSLVETQKGQNLHLLPTASMLIVKPKSHKNSRGTHPFSEQNRHFGYAAPSMPTAFLPEDAVWYLIFRMRGLIGLHQMFQQFG